MSAGTPDHYAALNAEIERLRGDPDFERDVDQVARGFGPPPDPEDLVIDDSGYFTACRVDELLAAGELRAAAVLSAGKQRADSWRRERRRRR